MGGCSVGALEPIEVRPRRHVSEVHGAATGELDDLAGEGDAAGGTAEPPGHQPRDDVAVGDLAGEGDAGGQLHGLAHRPLLGDLEVPEERQAERREPDLHAQVPRRGGAGEVRGPLARRPAGATRSQRIRFGVAPLPAPRSAGAMNASGKLADDDLGGSRVSSRVPPGTSSGGCRGAASGPAPFGGAGLCPHRPRPWAKISPRHEESARADFGHVRPSLFLRRAPERRGRRGRCQTRRRNSERQYSKESREAPERPDGCDDRPTASGLIHRSLSLVVAPRSRIPGAATQAMPSHRRGRQRRRRRPTEKGAPQPEG